MVQFLTTILTFIIFTAFALLLCIFIEDMTFGTMQTQHAPHYSATWARQISHEGLVRGTINWFLFVKN